MHNAYNNNLNRYTHGAKNNHKQQLHKYDTEMESKHILFISLFITNMHINTKIKQTIRTTITAQNKSIIHTHNKILVINI